MNRLARTRRWFFDELRLDQLALGAAIVTLLMIVIGAITRVSESGMGCGTYWLSCNGHIVPEFKDAATVIEFGHRVFALLVGIFALAGVPPSIGFTGKLLLFTSAMNQGYFWLVLIGAVNGTISLYYYLKVVYAAYFVEDGGLPPIHLSVPTRILNLALATIIIGFGVFPDRIVNLAREAVKGIL